MSFVYFEMYTHVYTAVYPYIGGILIQILKVKGEQDNQMFTNIIIAVIAVAVGAIGGYMFTTKVN